MAHYFHELLEGHPTLSHDYLDMSNCHREAQLGMLLSPLVAWASKADQVMAAVRAPGGGINAFRIAGRKAPNNSREYDYGYQRSGTEEKTLQEQYEQRCREKPTYLMLESINVGTLLRNCSRQDLLTTFIDEPIFRAAEQNAKVWLEERHQNGQSLGCALLPHATLDGNEKNETGSGNREDDGYHGAVSLVELMTRGDWTTADGAESSPTLELLYSPDWPWQAAEPTTLGTFNTNQRCKSELCELINGRRITAQHSRAMSGDGWFRRRAISVALLARDRYQGRVVPIWGRAMQLLARTLLPSRKFVGAMSSTDGKSVILTQYENGKVMTNGIRPQTDRQLCNSHSLVSLTAEDLQYLQADTGCQWLSPEADRKEIVDNLLAMQITNKLQ